MITFYEYVSVKEIAEGPSITMYTVKVHFSVRENCNQALQFGNIGSFTKEFCSAVRELWLFQSQRYPNIDAEAYFSSYFFFPKGEKNELPLTLLISQVKSDLLSRWLWAFIIFKWMPEKKL